LGSTVEMVEYALVVVVVVVSVVLGAMSDVR
jgi:hypothetical protein